MSDATDNKPPAEKKDLSMETRLLLALGLMGLVMFVTPYFFKAPPPPPGKKSEAAKTQKPASAPAQPPAPVVPEPAPDVPDSSEHTGAQSEQTFTVETDLYKVVLSNRGAVVREWILKKYQDDAGKPLELVNTAATAKVGFPFSLAFEQQKPAMDLNNVLYAVTPTADGLGITYEYGNGSVVARKSFHFQKNRYVTEFSSEVLIHGAVVPHVVEWRGGFGDPAISASSVHSVYFDVPDSKVITRDAKSAKNGPATSEGNYAFAGIEDTFFTAAFLTSENHPLKLITYSDTVATVVNPKEEPRAGSAIGSDGRNNFEIFVGPKDIDILSKVSSQLVKIVDFGWFSFLAKPLFLALHFVNDKWVHNYGWAIVIVTILINFLLFPLKLSNLKSMKKMQALQPQIKAINDKYKGISIRDPRKQQQNEEVMGLYKKHGANPMGGCLPMAIQIPFFIAFYKVLYVAIELRHASWLWVSDLSSAEHLPIHVLPVAMIATQFFLQKMTPSTSPDPNQQRMMMFMPLIMGFFFYGLPSGLVLYYLTVNLVGIVQQWFFNKTVTIADLPQPEPVAKKQVSRTRR
ncbi:MAG TPA: membrane protein insertase YidC [Bryobacteraceae bacterium]|nr:membrane protein insertase YidC [Bryobacteraceae bacterium]